MNKEAATIRSAQWRRIVDECINRDPEISKRQWCRDNGIKIRSLMYWQRKFQFEAVDQMSSIQSALPIQAATADVPVFVDVTAQVGTVREEPKPLLQEPEIIPLAPELMIQTGEYRIYVNSSVHEDTLKKVMRVIGHA